MVCRGVVGAVGLFGVLAAAWSPVRPLRPAVGGRRFRVSTALPAAPDQDLASAGAYPISPATRALGTQENLFAPRQYSYHEGTPFPALSHVCMVELSSAAGGGPCPASHITQAIAWLVSRHPALSRAVAGSGAPTGYLDELTLKMVRRDDPDPLTFVPVQATALEIAERVLSVEETGLAGEALEDRWREYLVDELDGASFDLEQGPLWRVRAFYPTSAQGQPVLVFTFNHAIDDQISFHTLLNDMLDRLGELKEGKGLAPPEPLPLPPSLEESVLGSEPYSSPLEAPGYMVAKALEGLKTPLVTPEGLDTKKLAGEPRSTALALRDIPNEVIDRIRVKCKELGVGLSAVLTAASVVASSELLPQNSASQPRVYKCLQALNMRNFGTWKEDGVSCQAGSMDLLLSCPPRAASSLAAGEEDGVFSEGMFWKLAKEADRQTKDFIAKDWPRDAVGVFDWGMRTAEMTNLVHLESQSESSLGRAYSCGVSNAGKFQRTGSGGYEVDRMYFAVSHARTGSTLQMSCLSVGDALRISFHPASPIISQDQAEAFADTYTDVLQRVVKPAKEPPNLDLWSGAIGFALVAASIAAYAPAWADFATEASAMWQSADGMPGSPSREDVTAALQFWTFFAAMHPLLTPVLWISEVLHTSPGPKIGDLVPVSFAGLNLVGLLAISQVRVLSNLVNGVLAALFFGCIGQGLAGGGDLSGYNLGLNDGGVRGCPSYAEVRQPSMKAFDVDKYQGRWFENAFHDWTQFTEVYDTTLDIELNADKSRWLDDFGLKGPSPTTSPRSFDKSPVANGAHYFLYGKVDKSTPGVLQETGFGVTFPNYIVDVKLSEDGTRYEEAIQFQCLEKGGVRVFEGINFLSRTPNLPADRLEDMHRRATAAGMDPYGSAPEQMHVVAHTDPETFTPIDNEWQQFWAGIGLPKLLALIESSTHSSFEDTGERVQ